MKKSLPNASGDLFLLDEETVKAGCESALESPRKRIIFPIQRTQDALVQRLINFMQPGTYIRPHKHPLAHATETMKVLQGAIHFFIFDDQGAVIRHFPVSSKDQFGVLDIEPNVWHSFIVTRPDTVLLEIKKGPYDAATDKEFAGWSPDEDTEESVVLLKKWSAYAG